MKIAITGAGGSVGAALVRGLAAQHETIALARGHLDVTDAAAVRRVVANVRPDLLINCAVVGVEACERDAARGWAVNAAGARHVAAAAEAAGARLLHLSTNYVFDGRRERGTFYTCADEPRPINEYGRSKLAGERAALAVCARASVVRTSWVFGAGAKDNFFSTVAGRLRRGERVRAVADVRASVTYVGDLAARVAELIERGGESGGCGGSELIERGGGAIFHVVNAGDCSYYEFALEAARLAGLDEEEAARLVEPTCEAEMRRTPRPRYTPLRCLASEALGLAPLRDWRAALVDALRAQDAPERAGEC